MYKAAYQQKIPGYVILISLALLGLLGYGGTWIYMNHKTPFEKATGYRDYGEMIAAKIAYDEQVQDSIRDLGGPGDDDVRAAAGDAEAQYRLGNTFLYGAGPQGENDIDAMKWFQKAAIQKYAKAEYQIGRMYAQGRGVPVDQKQAVKWYQLAADSGYKWAQIHLGEIYLHFLAEQFGVTRDFAEAYFWLDLGTATEDPNSDFIRDRDQAWINLSAEQKAAVDKRVQEWLKTHPAPAPNSPNIPMAKPDK